MNIALGINQMGGCEYYRTFVPYMELRRRGHYTVWFERIVVEEQAAHFPVGTIFARDVNKGVQPVTNADALVVQRLSDRNLLNACKVIQARGRTKIVYEFDDNFHSMPSHNPHAKSHGPGSELTRVIDEFVAMADLVVVSTDGLANEYARQRAGKPLVVCHNAIDDAVFHRFTPELTGEPKRPGKIRIGWAGSGTHTGDVRIVVPALCRLMEEFEQVEVVLLGSDLRGLFPPPFFRPSSFATTNRVSFIPGEYATHAFQLEDLISPEIAPLKYMQLLARSDFDIAIAPIEPNTFNRCKSWVKVLEYGMLGIPTVASNFGPYREYRSGGGQIELAESAGAWVRALRPLIVDADARLRLAFDNHTHIETNHLISRGADAWETALQAVVHDPVLA